MRLLNFCKNAQDESISRVDRDTGVNGQIQKELQLAQEVLAGLPRYKAPHLNFRPPVVASTVLLDAIFNLTK